jgi:hypothetical protein
VGTKLRDYFLFAKFFVKKSTIFVATN